MHARPVVLAAISLALIGGSSPAPRTTRYKVQTTSEQVVNLSAVGQGEQRTSFGLVNYFTITLDDTVGGRTVHAVLDSVIKADTSALTTQAVLDSARGRAWHALLTPENKISNVKQLDSAEAGGQASMLLNNFFPRVKRGAKVGDQWVDTTEFTNEQSGQTITTKTVTNYSVTGQEAHEGQQALKVEAAFSMAQTGVLNQGGGTMSIDGTGKGTATYWVTADGTYLGSNSTAMSDLQVTADQLPEPIPVHANNSVVVSIIK
ncbi:MAG: hypothetical protein ABI679_05810 [Gemmatimonadota bacterium]